MKSKDLQGLISLWKSGNVPRRGNPMPEIMVEEFMGTVFSPGDCYYYVFDYFAFEFMYVHPSVENVLGVKPEAFTMEEFLSRIHPEDVPIIEKREKAAMEFYFHRLPKEKFLSYKTVYPIRLRTNEGGYRQMLHQSLPLSVDEDGQVTHILGVHSDIGFLNPSGPPSVSFIGLNGEPSHLQMGIEGSTYLKPLSGVEFTKRELEVARRIAQGMKSKEVAAELNISVETVNTHRRNLLRKTESRNVAELIGKFIRNGWI
ncbi:MAG: LuxR C-terminal-related transcriptional regulator [Bacteroidota bacterium]|nr:LuxR C-terminal-related transcriptional regulator [Bacteroidota bacterium]